MHKNAPDNDKTGHNVLIWRVVIGNIEYQPSLPEFKGVHWFGIVSRLRLLGVSKLSDDAGKTIIDLEYGKGEDWNNKYDTPSLQAYLSLLKSYREVLKHRVTS
jgi:hypothetical protein